VDEEQALWEVATALGVSFDADAVMTRALAADALLKAVPRDADTPRPYDREWHQGMAEAAVPAVVVLLAEGRLDDYLTTGEHLTNATEAVAILAPLPDPDDHVYGRTLLEKLYARRHPAT
jgi:hypothetical protein